MGIPKRVKERLARLEARVVSLPDPEAKWERERLFKLHMLTWATRGSFEDIPEKDRDPRIWDSTVRYGGLDLGLIWEREAPGREELLADGVDFTLAWDVHELIYDRPYGAPGPDTPRKL